MTERRAVITDHWRARVAERLGAKVNAKLLADSILRELDSETGRVAYIGRITRNGRRAYRFDLGEELRGAAILRFGENRVTFITLLSPGFRIARQGKASRRA